MRHKRSNKKRIILDVGLSGDRRGVTMSETDRMKLRAVIQFWNMMEMTESMIQPPTMK